MRANQQPEVLCLGESMALVTPRAGERLAAGSTLQLGVAGAESNVAMYLADLGHRVRWLSRVGDDPLGRVVTGEIAASGVDVSQVEVVDDAPTGVFFKDPRGERTDVYYYRAGSAATGMGPGQRAAVLAGGARLVHLTGITPALSTSCRELVESLLLDRAPGGPQFSFDVNLRSRLWRSDPASYLLRLADAADVVLVGLDEANALWGCVSFDDVRARLPHPRHLVVKNGAGPARAFDGLTWVEENAPVVEVVEPVGAGDAFAAGWISGLLRGIGPAGRLRLGHHVAGAALASTSDHAALGPVAEIMGTLGIHDAPVVDLA